MNVVTTAIEGVLILEPKVLGDSRGFFMESLRVSADFPVPAQGAHPRRLLALPTDTRLLRHQ